VEKPDAFELVADAPGFTTDNITITLDENRTLTVSGKLEQDKEESTGEGERKVWRSERRSQQFTRSFTLPENTKPEEICASLEKGVLTVSIPKKPEAPKPEPRRIEVKTA
jgi:HSP20 family protein